MSSAPPTFAMPGSPEKRRERLDAQKVLRLLTKALAPLGFTRTKPSYFTRPGDLVVEFIHIHKYSFGPYFRIHLGIRVLNDAWHAVALNGPCFDGLLNSEGSLYVNKFEFTPDPISIVECAQLLTDAIRCQGEPWFSTMRPPEHLLGSAESPLRATEKASLRSAMSGSLDAAAIQMSRSCLGLG